MSNETETKLCKHCQTEIPRKAKVCPHCRKKQSKGFLKWILIIIFALVVIGILASMGDDNEPEKVGEVTTDVSVPEDTGETIFRVGEIAELKNVQVTLLSYDETTGSQWAAPADGNVFVLAEFEIANNTDHDLAISSMLSFEAYADDYTLNYSLSALLARDGLTQLDGTIAAGKKMKGWIGWEVPSDWSEVEIHFTDNVWSNNNFKFIIEK